MLRSSYKTGQDRTFPIAELVNKLFIEFTLGEWRMLSKIWILGDNTPFDCRPHISSYLGSILASRLNSSSHGFDNRPVFNLKVQTRKSSFFHMCSFARCIQFLTYVGICQMQLLIICSSLRRSFSGNMEDRCRASRYPSEEARTRSSSSAMRNTVHLRRNEHKIRAL